MPAPDLTFTPSEGVTVPEALLAVEADEELLDEELLDVVDDEDDTDPLTDRKSDLIYPLFPEYVTLYHVYPSVPFLLPVTVTLVPFIRAMMTP